MNERIVLFIMITVAIFAGEYHAYALENPAEPPVLSAPVSARSTALGNALYCSPFDAVRYNPAYLGVLAGAGIMGTYGIVRQETTFGSANGVMKRGDFGLGFGVSDVRSRFESFDGPNTAAAGSVTAAETLVSLAAGTRAGEDLLLGGAARLLYDDVAGSASVGTSLDVGAGYLFSRRFQAGLVLHNVVSLFPRNEDNLLPKLTLGIAYHPGLQIGGQSNLSANTFVFALSKNSLDNPTLSFGWESVWHNLFALRLGFDRDYPVMGFGFIAGIADIDIAAAFKSGGPLYFATVGTKFGEKRGVSPAAERQKPQQAKTTAAAPEDDRRLRVNEMTVKGWDLLRVNDLTGALNAFTAALGLDPEYSSAVYGRQITQKELEKAKRRSQVKGFVAEGRAAMEKGDYLKAEDAVRAALDADPDSAEAKEVLRLSVQRMNRDIEGYLKKTTKEKIPPATITAGDAFALFQSGSFKAIDGVLRDLAGNEYKSAAEAWQKVTPEDNVLVRRFKEAFASLRIERPVHTVENATRLADQGSYADACRELEAAARAPGLSAAEVQKIKGYISAYEYVGKSVSRTNLDEAQNLISGGSFDEAAARLRKAIRSGFFGEEAQKLLDGIASQLKENGTPPAPAAPAVAPPKKAAPAAHHGTKGTKKGRTKKKAYHAPPQPQAQPQPPAQKAAPEGRAPAIDQRITAPLLKEYREQASALFGEGRWAECREYLRKILYLDPRDSEAQRMLKDVQRRLAPEGK